LGKILWNEEACIGKCLKYSFSYVIVDGIVGSRRILMENNHLVVIGRKITGAVEKYIIDSVVYFPTTELALCHMRFLMKGTANVGYIQLGTESNSITPNSITVYRSNRTSDWSIVAAPIWTKEQVILYAKQIATLGVPYTKSKEMRMRLGWGYAKWVKELFTEKFGVIFNDDGERSYNDKSKTLSLVYSCFIPAEAERALTQSYGCSISRPRSGRV